MESAEILDRLSQVIAERADALASDTTAADKSYTASLLHDGREKILRKLGEEALEVVLAASLHGDDPTQIRAESADLLYHLLVLWQDAGISPDQVWAELARRHGISGLDEKAARHKPKSPKETS